MPRSGRLCSHKPCKQPIIPDRVLRTRKRSGVRQILKVCKESTRVSAKYAFPKVCQKSYTGNQCWVYKWQCWSDGRKTPGSICRYKEDGLVSRPPAFFTSVGWPMHGTIMPKAKSQLKSTCLTVVCGTQTNTPLGWAMLRIYRLWLSISTYQDAYKLLTNVLTIFFLQPRLRSQYSLYSYKHLDTRFRRNLVPIRCFFTQKCRH